MTYAELIKRLEPFKDEQVSFVQIGNAVEFYPASDGNNPIIALEHGEEEPFLAEEVQL